MGEIVKTPEEIMAEKLTAIQTEIKAPKDKYNEFGKFKYRSCESILEAVKPHLKKHGVAILLSDEIVEIGGRIYVKATAQLTDGRVPVEVCAYAREEDTKKGMDGSQITGTASSYARKYALNGLLAIDDTKDADTNEYTNQSNSGGKKGTSKKAATENPTNINPNILCSECGNEIVDHLPNATRQMIIDATRNIYKKALCFECLAKHEKAKREKAEMKKAFNDAGEYQAIIHEDAGDRE